MTFLRSLLFMLWFSLVSATLAILFLPALLGPRAITAWMARRWSLLTFFGLRVLAGIKFEVRGQKPPNGTLVAVKHMSMWDTCAIYTVLDDPAIVLKRGLQTIPFYGWYLWKARMIPIDREGGPSTLRKMAAAGRAELAAGRSVVIFPEGTRRKVDAPPDYKTGVAGLYGQLGVPCVPVALSSGLFWTGFIKRSGTIILEFLPPIPPGLPRREFMPRLEAAIESASGALIAEGRNQLKRGNSL
ncbi:MAG TPA: lysophospholipid acyltransferase family protein [Rhizomicrobium sp.]|jgi:1-acyl-sn-glycerol-3-phosphate acyltransferase|nr:lysophospholipid acyltransferase family protein [Rhizomicrobium sp.]